MKEISKKLLKNLHELKRLSTFATSNEMFGPQSALLEIQKAAGCRLRRYKIIKTACKQQSMEAAKLKMQKAGMQQACKQQSMEVAKLKMQKSRDAASLQTAKHGSSKAENARKQQS